MSEWKTIDTAPKDGTVVLLFRPRTTVGRANQLIFGAWSKNSWVWPDTTFNPYQEGMFHNLMDEHGNFCSDEFTHWMPLPEPPKAA